MAIKLTSKVTVELPIAVSASEVFKEEIFVEEENITTEE